MQSFCIELPVHPNSKAPFPETYPSYLQPQIQFQTNPQNESHDQHSKIIENSIDIIKFVVTGCPPSPKQEDQSQKTRTQCPKCKAKVSKISKHRCIQCPKCYVWYVRSSHQCNVLKMEKKRKKQELPNRIEKRMKSLEAPQSFIILDPSKREFSPEPRVASPVPLQVGDFKINLPKEEFKSQGDFKIQPDIAASNLHPSSISKGDNFTRKPSIEKTCPAEFSCRTSSFPFSSQKESSIANISTPIKSSMDNILPKLELASNYSEERKVGTFLGNKKITQKEELDKKYQNIELPFQRDVEFQKLAENYWYFIVACYQESNSKHLDYRQKLKKIG